MPEWAEVRISGDYINKNCELKKFNKLFHVEKLNIATQDGAFSDFTINAISNGKELVINSLHNDKEIPIYIFMGMNGGWKYIPTENWQETKHVRLRFDDETGNSLILFGGYMGPKYSIGKKFTGVKRGPDPIDSHEEFRQNIINNLEKKAFDKPIYEVLLNQAYFNGIGNYLRSTILYYLDVNPFSDARTVISNNPEILNLCREIPLKAYELNGGQLRDWKNPFGGDTVEFDKWVFYQKGEFLKDSDNRTFWYNKKWKQ